MQTTNTPLPKSRLQLEFDLPPERLDRAIGQAVGRLARQTRVPGFRPGKAPRVMLERVLGPAAVLEEALDQLVDDAYREAVVDQDLAPLAPPDVEMVQGEEGKPVIFKAVVPVRPDVTLGDFEHFNFVPAVEPVDETKVEKVVDELRDSEARLEAVDRDARLGDYVIVAFNGTRDGEAFLGGSSEQMPLILGENRLYPGMDDQVVGLRKGEEREFDLDIPADFQVEAMRGLHLHFKLTLKELRAKIVPDADDAFARSVGRFNDLDHLKAELRKRLEENALDRARHEFAERIVEYAASNATSMEMPDVLIEQEIGIMRDEMTSAMARQGISEEAYLKVTGKTEEQLREELAPQAEKRVKSLFVLTEIAKIKGIEVPESDVEAEVERARTRYADDKSMVQYFESTRGRNYIRSSFERTRTVELLVDEWLAAHPDAPRLRHIEEAPERSAINNPSEPGAGAVETVDAGILTSPEATAPMGA
ncbi:MAG: trigger factor [Candidatus Limnocylindrales bacterium]|jgi:trigger factor